ncbi:hypothetical protein D3C71_1685880 [compost metagenome]
MLDQGGAHACATARESTHACLQLRQRKGLGHVVVGPQIEALHALVHAFGGGEDQHGYRRATRAQPFEHFQPVHLGQAQVEDQQVKLVVGHQCGIGFGAGGHVVHHSARVAQTAQQAVGQHLVVFGNQNSHGVSCWYALCAVSVDSRAC